MAKRAKGATETKHVSFEDPWVSCGKKRWIPFQTGKSRETLDSEPPNIRSDPNRIPGLSDSCPVARTVVLADMPSTLGNPKLGNPTTQHTLVDVGRGATNLNFGS